MRSTITDTGRGLLSRAEMGEITMEISEVRTGSGVYGASEEIASRTELKEEKNTYPISYSALTADGLALSAVVANVDAQGHSVVPESYHINEIGVYATVGEEKYLYMIAVCEGDVGNVLPAYNGKNAIDFVERFLLTVSNTANITVNMSGAYALSEDVMAWIAAAVGEHAELPIHLTAQERILWNGEETRTTIFEQDGTVTEITDMGVKTTMFNADGSITESYPDGRILTTYFEDGSVRRVLGGWEPLEPEPEPEPEPANETPSGDEPTGDEPSGENDGEGSENEGTNGGGNNEEVENG